MRLFKCIIFMLLFAAGHLQAQSPEDYFHESANLYIGANLPEALRVGILGLQQYSTDKKLNALVEKIKKELEKQKQQQQKQQQQQQQQQEQEKKSDEQQPQDDQKKNEQENKEQQQQQQHNSNNNRQSRIR